MAFIENDIESSNFDAAQLKIDTMNKLLVRCADQPPQLLCEEITEEKLKAFIKGLNIPGLNYPVITFIQQVARYVVLSLLFIYLFFVPAIN